MPRKGCWIDAVQGAVLALANGATLVHGEPGILASPMTVVQADPHHAGTLLAGTSTARLFRSRDGAGTWSPLPFPGALRSTLHALLIDPSKPDTYLAAVSSEIL